MALVPMPTTSAEIIDQHQQFEALQKQLFSCVEQLRKVHVIDSQSLGLKLSQLDDAHSTQASLRQQLEQQHAEMSRLKNDCIRFETENAGLKRDVQVLKNDARKRQTAHQDELLELEKLLNNRDSDARETKRKLTDLTFDHEDVKLQLRDSQAEVVQLRAELQGYEQEAASTSVRNSQVQHEADGAIRQLTKERQTLLNKVEALEQRLRASAEETERQQQQLRDMRVSGAKKDEIMHDREDTIVTLERKTAQLSTALETANVEVDSLRGKSVDLESQLAATRAEFERVTKNMQTQLSQSTALQIRDAGAQRNELETLREANASAAAELRQLRHEKQHWDEKFARVEDEAAQERHVAAQRISQLEGDVRRLLQNVKDSNTSLKHIGDRAATSNRALADAAAAPKLSKEEQARATADDIRAQMAQWQAQQEQDTEIQNQLAQQRLHAQYEATELDAGGESSALVKYEGGGHTEAGGQLHTSPASRAMAARAIDDEVLRDAALLEQHLRRTRANR